LLSDRGDRTDAVRGVDRRKRRSTTLTAAGFPYLDPYRHPYRHKVYDRLEKAPLGSAPAGLLVSHAEKRPEVVAEAKRLRRASPTTGERRSLQRISRELAAKGYVNERGQPFNPKSVRAMLKRK
jgi:hypothetical protein